VLEVTGATEPSGAVQCAVGFRASFQVVFGMSFGELCVLVVVAIVVIGPKDLPRFLRKAGQFAGRLRRMASDVRAQSGIDEVIRAEGLTRDIAEIRRLAQGDFIDPVRRSLSLGPANGVQASPSVPPSYIPPSSNEFVIVREREYPTEGADSYGTIPDSAIMYANGLPVSPLASDPLYVVGDADGALPAPEPSAEEQPADASLVDSPPDDKAEAASPTPDARSA
jgi:sec-independent protein translocase protein TatB